MGDWKCMACACLLGVLNNNAYSTVIGASQPLAKQFAMSDYMSLFSSFLLASCTCATLFNSAVCLKIGIHVRVLVLMTFIGGGYIMLSIASTMAGKVGFMTALLACSLVGVATSLGEIGNLAFFRAFPPCILGAWGAGTGIAGVTGGSVYVFLREMGLSNPQIFALMFPSVIVYYACFRYLYGRAKECGVLNMQKDIGEKNAELNIANAREVSKYTWAILVNMVAVYTLEYTIYPGLVDRDTLCPISNGFLATHAFTIMWTCYNIGVTLSRASVSWFRIENLWLITGLQALNVALWSVEATQHSILNYFGNAGYYVLLAWMIWVGLMGGSCYANCMYAYNTRSTIPDNFRELGINLGFVMSNIGIFAATNITTLLQTTILSSDKLFPGGCPAPVM
jgi:battenin